MTPQFNSCFELGRLDLGPCLELGIATENLCYINIASASTRTNLQTVHQLPTGPSLQAVTIFSPPSEESLAPFRPKTAFLIVTNYQRNKMARFMPLKASFPGVSCLHVKLPPVKWMHFTMHESHFLGKDDYWSAWSYTWKAILLASGVAHDGSTSPARFLLSKHDDHALAVLLRTTIVAEQVGDTDIVSYITGKPIFSSVSKTWADDNVDDEAIEIVYPSELSKEEAGRFSVRGKPLEVIEYEVIEHEAAEHEVETEVEE